MIKQITTSIFCYGEAEGHGGGVWGHASQENLIWPTEIEFGSNLFIIPLQFVNIWHSQ